MRAVVIRYNSDDGLSSIFPLLGKPDCQISVVHQTQWTSAIRPLESPRLDCDLHEYRNLPGVDAHFVRGGHGDEFELLNLTSELSVPEVDSRCSRTGLCRSL